MPPVGRDEGGDGGGDKLCGRVGEVRLQGVLVAAALDQASSDAGEGARSDVRVEPVAHDEDAGAVAYSTRKSLPDSTFSGRAARARGTRERAPPHPCWRSMPSACSTMYWLPE